MERDAEATARLPTKTAINDAMVTMTRSHRV